MNIARAALADPKLKVGLANSKMIHSVSDEDPNCIVNETLFFTVPSTSGLVSQYQLPDKVKLFETLKSILESLPSLNTSSMRIVASVKTD
ncbi:hypothetical protein C8J56DRAFT_958980 [Mycena floridula]|nr:hypothetical protein C8J56DRAFT_958980 [Mycena floridula]